MMNRRDLLKSLSATAALPFLPDVTHAQPPKKASTSFVYCVNMATIRGHKLGFVKELEVVSKAGFRAAEIWIDSLQAYLKEGGTPKDAKKRLDDLGIKVENTIGFAPWIIDDETKRKEGLEQMKREMDLLAQIGCKRVAAPPVGATNEPVLNLKTVAERYRTLLELGDKTGVIPHLEMWGFSKNLSRVSEVAYVALESGHPSAKVLLDVFHLYKGGSSLDTLQLISPTSLEIFHMNDYTANLTPATITDADRIYPGDGVAPIRRILQTLGKREKPLVLSVEVFNKNYYAQDALVVAKTALAKLKAVTAGI
ncbi:sugar phosphate isomerase/epimerase family protein [Segetibacter sp.]|jgi:2-keto-myo-inositol isomerase|uniref:sugar phosphate isomerase/epimerase family protein n=1 Tax=Segetibacter sp. TaxID=2231182 RepID=UPI00261E4193|nr:sugar phosphate isomerase/epimerase family protein [Segetibacter sp.]MCW3080666.1 xylose isomerase [Segetibacter sp.]